MLVVQIVVFFFTLLNHILSASSAKSEAELCLKSRVWSSSEKIDRWEYERQKKSAEGLFKMNDKLLKSTF